MTEETFHVSVFLGQAKKTLLVLKCGTFWCCDKFLAEQEAIWISCWYLDIIGIYFLRLMWSFLKLGVVTESFDLLFLTENRSKYRSLQMPANCSTQT